MKNIYLSGPIMDEVERSMPAPGVRCGQLLRAEFILLDPMRRNFKDREVDSANEIVEFDLQDVRDADILLVNYSKPSIGTAMEVFYASHDLGKFVVAFSPFSFKDCSPWMVRFCTKILPSPSNSPSPTSGSTSSRSTAKEPALPEAAATSSELSAWRLEHGRHAAVRGG